MGSAFRTLLLALLATLLLVASAVRVAEEKDIGDLSEARMAKRGGARSFAPSSLLYDSFFPSAKRLGPSPYYFYEAAKRGGARAFGGAWNDPSYFEYLRKREDTDRFF